MNDQNGTGTGVFLGLPRALYDALEAREAEQDAWIPALLALTSRLHLRTAGGGW